ALAAGVAETGCTVHVVDGGMDTGPIILQQSVPILPDDTPASLHARIQEAEHLLYPAAISKLVASRSKIAMI
ncbi:MAG: formyltransferase family protein, partial [Verrucomicrobiota bacterium]